MLSQVCNTATVEGKVEVGRLTFTLAVSYCALFKSVARMKSGGADGHANKVQANADKQTPSENIRDPNCLQKAGSFLAGGLEQFYYRQV